MANKFSSRVILWVLLWLAGGVATGCTAPPTTQPPPAATSEAVYAPPLSSETAVSPTPITPLPTGTPAPPPMKTVVSPTAPPPPAPPPTATSAADLLAAYTLDSLRRRPDAGGPITIREKTAQHDTFAVYTIAYPSGDLTLTGQMHVPEGEGPFPVIILLHGFMFRDSYQTGDDTWLAAQNLAGSGYITIAPDFRSWGGSDTGPSYFHTGLVIDTLDLIASLPSLPQADPDRLGLWGHSMGGGIATKVLTVSDAVKTAVLYAPNSADDADLIARWGPGCLPDQIDHDYEANQCNPAEILPPDMAPDLRQAYLETAADPERLQAFAPYYHLDHVNAPVQIHIGAADGQSLVETPPTWSQKLAEGLQAAGKEVTFFSYDGQGHFFSGDSWEQFMARTVNFFNAHLK